MSNYCQGRRKPRMHVSKVHGKARKDWFLIHKYIPLCDEIKKPEAFSIFYNSSDFVDLLDKIINTPDSDGLRIHFASYPSISDDFTPDDFNDLLTLIYVPTKGINDIPNSYYILNPGSEPELIPSEIAINWINNYQTVKLPILTNIIDLHEPDPQDNYDTKSMLYEISDIKEFKEEITCQKAHGVRMYFSSFTDSDPDPTVDEKYYKRLIPQFVLTRRKDRSQVDIFIEDMPGWAQRPNARPRPEKFLDTGSPCPPASCP